MSKVIVFGGGLSGLGAEKLLKKNGYTVYLVDDKNGISSEEGIKILNNEKIEFIVKSPGIPWTVKLLEKAKEIDVEIISEIDLAYKYMDKSIKIISFTGTNGKTTTSTKTAQFLQYAGYRAKLAGNAGFSYAGIVADDEKLDYIVLELSSYQLENNPKVNSQIAGIINLTPDHLARYNSVEDYYVTKFNIFKNQNENEVALINLDDKNFEELYKKDEIKKMIKGKKLYLSKNKKGNIFVHNNGIYVMNDIEKMINIEENNVEKVAYKLMDRKNINLKGEHNLENMLFLIGVAKTLNISNEKICDFLQNVEALEHRMEDFFVKENTTFINDSKGTNGDSTITAINSYNNEIVLILGGDDKKIDNTQLIEKIKEKVSFVYLIGENAPILEKEMINLGYKNYKIVETIENALNYLKENEDFSKDKTVLFSPATSSFCQFNNFEHRGKMFKQRTIEILK